MLNFQSARFASSAPHKSENGEKEIQARLSVELSLSVFVSKRGLESVEGHFHETRNFQAVQMGDKISFGKRDPVFVKASMLHWPDSMLTHPADDGILMPNDVFGQHYGTSSRFSDEVDQEGLYQEVLTYYANILPPSASSSRRRSRNCWLSSYVGR